MGLGGFFSAASGVAGGLSAARLAGLAGATSPGLRLASDCEFCVAGAGSAGMGATAGAAFFSAVDWGAAGAPFSTENTVGEAVVIAAGGGTAGPTTETGGTFSCLGLGAADVGAAGAFAATVPVAAFDCAGGVLSTVGADGARSGLAALPASAADEGCRRPRISLRASSPAPTAPATATAAPIVSGMRPAADGLDNPPQHGFFATGSFGTASITVETGSASSSLSKGSFTLSSASPSAVPRQQGGSASSCSVTGEWTAIASARANCSDARRSARSWVSTSSVPLSG